MQMRWLIIIVFLSSLFGAVIPNAKASHIIGGEVCYTFQNYDSINQKFIYEIKMQLYRDTLGATCPATVDFEVYENDTPSRSLDTTVTLNFNNSEIIDYVRSAGCGYPSSLTAETCSYTGTIALDSSTTGYHLVYQGCCRKVTVDNTVDTTLQGITFYNFIPPTNLRNSSACFSDFATPFACANDSICLSNHATDPDGDSLVYSFGTPYRAMPDTPYIVPAQFSHPFDTVLYKSGYAPKMPFGSGSSATIDPSTGLACLYIPSNGNYLWNIEVKEYRNGQLIGRTRREIRLLAYNCPSLQTKPVLIDSNGLPGMQYNYYVQEKDTLRFLVRVKDQEGDSLFLNRFGGIFDSTVFNNPAVLPETKGDSLLSTSFEWATDCGDARSQPYQFFLNVNDDGCPNKLAQYEFNIYVSEFSFPPDQILGADSLCPGRQASYTHADSLNSYGYNWSVVNGNILGSDSSNQVTVKWSDTVGTGLVRLKRSYRCETDTIQQTVQLDSSINILVQAVSPVTLCKGQSDTLRLTNVDSTLKYRWSPSTNLNNDTVPQPVVQPGSNMTYTVTASYGACTGTDQVDVQVNPNPSLKMPGDTSICPDDSVAMNIQATNTQNMLWIPDDNLVTDTGMPTLFFPDQPTMYTVVATSVNNCKTRDTLMIDFRIPPDVQAGEDKYIVEGETVQLSAQGAKNYVWSPAESLNNNQQPDPMANPGVTTTYYVKGIDDAGCISYDTLMVHVEQPVKLPNGFTPNNDGRNDVVYVTGTGIAEMEFKIFNRWGKLVFYSQNQEKGWDGTDPSGQPQPVDTYVYQLYVKLESGQTINKRGNIALIR